MFSIKGSQGRQGVVERIDFMFVQRVRRAGKEW